jgi:hypothetical protein
MRPLHLWVVLVSSGLVIGIAAAQSPAPAPQVLPPPTDMEILQSRSETAEKIIANLNIILRRYETVIIEYQVGAAANLKDPAATAKWWSDFAAAMGTQKQ